MATVLITSTSPTYDAHNEKTWTDLIVLLRPYIRHYVYSARIRCWQGQKEDIIDDIIQETVSRILERSQQAERGEAMPIYSLTYMSITIARNYCIDRMRRDCRIQRIILDSDKFLSEGAPIRNDQINPLEEAIECVYHEELFIRLAHEIAQFPVKRRRALLIDLANRMYFDIQPTPLQAAFLKEGINLQLYQQPLPSDLIERARQAALSSLAYKRVALLMSEYMLDNENDISALPDDINNKKTK